MPEKPLTIAAYAAGASLAAVTLVYVFGPTFFLDDEAAQSSRSSRRKGIVGLHNPANDCFINAVLQTLAGLPELRVFLIRELHRRELERGTGVYDVVSAPREEEEEEDKDGKRGKEVPEWKMLGLQKGLVTAALKEVLDSLNERPIYRKTISASGFVRVLELAFRTRLNRSQQDAQEFLQVVTERLGDEYHAAGRVRRRAAKRRKVEAVDTEGLEKSEETIRPRKVDADANDEEKADEVNGQATQDFVTENRPPIPTEDDEDNEPGFPFEGKIESQIECTHCHFKPKPSVSDFVTLTLHVPQAGKSTTLNACFDGMLKVEHIDDFKCERCRLEHAISVKEKEAQRADSEKSQTIESDIAHLRETMASDPEEPPKDIPLPPLSEAPARRITRHSRISSHPRILAIHLSRSMFDTNSATTKNLAKVSFPETLPLGGILDRQTYRLLGVVTHKGGHNSGHYESFRRQVLREPYSTPTRLGTEGLYGAMDSRKSSGIESSPSLRPQGSAVGDVANNGPNVPSPLHDMTPSSSSASGSGSGSSLDQPLDSSASTTSSASALATPSPTKLHRQPSSTPSISELPTPSIITTDSNSNIIVSNTASLDTTPTTDEPTPLPSPQRLKKKDSISRLSDSMSRLRRASLSRTSSGSASQKQQQPTTDRESEKRAKEKREKDKKMLNRWWRISDDKVRECKTSEVLGMQREVYLLFYELLPSGEEEG